MRLSAFAFAAIVSLAGRGLAADLPPVIPPAVDDPPPVRAVACPCPRTTCICTPANCACKACDHCGFKPVADAKPAYAVLVDSRYGGGSGTVVHSEKGRSIIVTNRHVAAYVVTYTVTLNDGRKFPARVLGALSVEGDGRPDVAALEVEAELPTAKLAPEDAATKTPVVFWGRTTPFGRGRILGHDNTFPAPRVMGDWQSESGDSGSGVFDTSGRLVAVHIGFGREPLSRRRAVRIRDVHYLLDWVKTLPSSPPRVQGYEAVGDVGVGPIPDDLPPVPTRR